MIEDDRTTRLRHCPLGLVGALILIVAVEYQVTRHPLACMGGSYWGYEISRGQADQGVKDCDVLCFGDSLLKQGLSPLLIEARSGLRAYNFAAPGGQAPGSYFLLRRALASGARPSAIVVEYLPRLMAEHPNFNIQNWPFVASPLDCLEMAWIDGNPILFAKLAVRDFLPSVRCRDSIRFNLGLALNGTFAGFKNEINTARRHWEVNRGGEIIPSRTPQFEDLESWIRGYFVKFSCRRINKTYIDKFMDLAAEKQIPVFWVLPPYKPALQARCEQSGFDAEHEAFIRSVQARHPGLHVIDSRYAGYDPKVFTDLHHLGREGATAHSTAIADLLLRNRTDPGSIASWVKMPQYRPVTSLVPLEEFEQSRARVLESAAKEQTTRTR